MKLAWRAEAVRRGGRDASDGGDQRPLADGGRAQRCGGHCADSRRY